MDQAGGLMDTVNYMMASVSALLHPRPHLFSPTCQETQPAMPGSSASTGGLSEMVTVHSIFWFYFLQLKANQLLIQNHLHQSLDLSFDSAILFLVIYSHLKQKIPNDFHKLS